MFVNSNGSLSFGAGSLDFSETIAEMLTGPPRIAGLWDDLDAVAAPGSVTFSETSRSLTVTFTNVPEFLNSGANTFSITLFATVAADGDEWDATEIGGVAATATADATVTGGSRSRTATLSATDGLAGYSCGGRITSGFERETDLSKAARRTIDGDGETAIFEIFNAVPGDNDLANRTLEFDGPGRFRDAFEPNDSPVLAPHARSRSRADTMTTMIAGEGWCDCRSIPPIASRRSVRSGTTSTSSDFRAKAGDILAIETVPGLSEHGHRARTSSTQRATSCWPTTMAASVCCRGCSCRSPWTARMPWACRRSRTWASPAPAATSAATC